MESPDRFTPRQLGIVLTIAAVQFINILDFLIIMPLNPWFRGPLGIQVSQMGAVAGAYAAAASMAGLAGAFFLDRFDRRKALAVALGGLVLGTAMGGFSQGFGHMLAARFIAGAFGGPATSLAFSIIADTIPPKIRGRAMGIVMGAFSVASVLGVWFGLQLAQWWGWRAPFFFVAALGVVVGLAAIGLLPPMRSHLEKLVAAPISFGALISRPLVQLSYLMTAVTMTSGFILIPNIPGFLTLNLGFPATQLGYAYAFGGAASFVATQSGGWLVDKFGSLQVGSVGALGSAVVVFTVFFLPHDAMAAPLVYLTYVAFMISMGLRNVSYNTLATKVPEPQVRARFQSLQSSVQHGATALAAWLSSALLTQGVRPDGGERLEGVPRVAGISIAMALLIPVLLGMVEKRVKAKLA